MGSGGTTALSPPGLFLSPSSPLHQRQRPYISLSSQQLLCDIHLFFFYFLLSSFLFSSFFLFFFISFLFLTFFFFLLLSSFFFFFLFYFFFFLLTSFLFLLSSTKTSRPLLFLHPLSSILPYKTLERCMVKPLGQLVCVSSTAHTAYTPHLSTSSSTTTLTDSKSGMTHLKASFVLRCFQHLSLPHLATRQCNRHYNRYTSDASTPVLSY